MSINSVAIAASSSSEPSVIVRGLVRQGSGERTITFLDGDVVRRELSAGLGFSRVAGLQQGAFAHAGRAGEQHIAAFGNLAAQGG